MIDMAYRRSLLAAAMLVMLLSGCGAPENSGFHGYIEGEYLYLAAPQGGYLETLDVSRGNRVSAGQRVFAIEIEPDAQALAEAEAKAGSAEARVRNLTQPRRRAEVAALEAELRAAQAARRLAATNLDQIGALARKDFVSQARLDEARSVHDQAVARTEAASQQLETYRASVGREEEVRGAQADLRAAVAAAARSRWLVERKTVVAPEHGELTETYYRPGEWVPAGAAVASLLSDTRRRLRFFVPETALAGIALGQPVEATCDGCPKPIRGTIEFISAQAEYTPPVVFSRGRREKLVFRVEAAPPPEQAAGLRPGLPIDVRLAGR